MEEDKTTDKIEKSERLVGGKIKSFLLVSANFTQTERFSHILTVLLKVLGIVLIAKIYFSLNAIGSTFLHDGPSCDAHESSFQYWLSKKNDKATIISISAARLQTLNGTSSCHGFYKLKGKDNYSRWEGTISDSSEGVIGKISI